MHLLEGGVSVSSIRFFGVKDLELEHRPLKIPQGPLVQKTLTTLPSMPLECRQPQQAIEVLSETTTILTADLATRFTYREKGRISEALEKCHYRGRYELVTGFGEGCNDKGIQKQRIIVLLDQDPSFPGWLFSRRLKWITVQGFECTVFTPSGYMYVPSLSWVPYPKPRHDVLSKHWSCPVAKGDNSAGPLLEASEGGPSSRPSNPVPESTGGTGTRAGISELEGAPNPDSDSGSNASQRSRSGSGDRATRMPPDSSTVLVSQQTTEEISLGSRLVSEATRTTVPLELRGFLLARISLGQNKEGRDDPNPSSRRRPYGPWCLVELEQLEFESKLLGPGAAQAPTYGLTSATITAGTTPIEAIRLPVLTPSTAWIGDKKSKQRADHTRHNDISLEAGAKPTAKAATSNTVFTGSEMDKMPWDISPNGFALDRENNRILSLLTYRFTGPSTEAESTFAHAPGWKAGFDYRSAHAVDQEKRLHIKAVAQWSSLPSSKDEMGAWMRRRFTQEGPKGIHAEIIHRFGVDALIGIPPPDRDGRGPQVDYTFDEQFNVAKLRQGVTQNFTPRNQSLESREDIRAFCSIEGVIMKKRTMASRLKEKVNDLVHK